jgi:uncharacterized protein
VLLSAAFFAAALLYAAVGHGGASGYLAIMALAAFSPTEMRPLALMMNVAVSAIAWINFSRAGHFRGKLFLPLIALALPCAYWGGLHRLDDAVYGLVLGCTLLVCALYLLMPTASSTDQAAVSRTPSPLVTVPLGAVLGGLAGLTGIGGGIFLSPVLILARFASSKEAGALSAAFIFLNSLAGLAALKPTLAALPDELGLWLGAVCAGGLIGSQLGAFKLPGAWIRRLLAMVLLVAAVKLLWD